MSRHSLRNRNENVTVDFEQDENAGALQPEVRIIRPVNIEAAEVASIDRFANKLGKMNRGKGVARSAGSMCLTLVTATEMGRMLHARYPSIYDSRRKVITLHRRIARDYNQFVEERAKGIDDQAFGLLTTLGALYGEDEMWEEDDIRTSIDDKPLVVDEMLWQDASFAPASYGKFGSSKLGLDLSNSDTLCAEMEATRDYLRAEGLNTDVIDPTRSPHITIFETFAVLGKTSLTAPAPPPMVPLQPPRMLGNTNQRTQGV